MKYIKNLARRQLYGYDPDNPKGPPLTSCEEFRVWMFWDVEPGCIRTPRWKWLSEI